MTGARGTEADVMAGARMVLRQKKGKGSANAGSSAEHDYFGAGT